MFNFFRRVIAVLYKVYRFSKCSILRQNLWLMAVHKILLWLYIAVKIQNSPELRFKCIHFRRIRNYSDGKNRLWDVHHHSLLGQADRKNSSSLQRLLCRYNSIPIAKTTSETNKFQTKKLFPFKSMKNLCAYKASLRIDKYVLVIS